MMFYFGDKVTHNVWGRGIWIRNGWRKGMADVYFRQMPVKLPSPTLVNDFDLTEGWASNIPIKGQARSSKERGARKQKQGINKPLISRLQNLLLNMSGGLKPEHLTKSEEDLLIEEYGVDWKKKLGKVKVNGLSIYLLGRSKR